MSHVLLQYAVYLHFPDQVRANLSPIMAKAKLLIQSVDAKSPGGSDFEHAVSKLNDYLQQLRWEPNLLIILDRAPFIETHITSAAELQKLFGHLQHLAGGHGHAGLFLGGSLHNEGTSVMLRERVRDP